MGLYWGHNVYYWLFAVVIIFVLLSLVSLLGLALGLDIRQSMSQSAVTRGETAEIRLVIKNKTLFFCPRIDLTVSTVLTRIDGSVKKQSVVVPPLKDCEIVINLPCKYRGIYTVGIKKCRVYDMFGLFNFAPRRWPLQTLAVYPQTINIELPRLSGQNDDDEQARDIRSFRPGDTPRRMHWKASARMRKWMVREYDVVSDPQYLVILDTAALGEGKRAARIESRACDCAYSLAQEALLRGRQTQLHTSRPGTLDICRPSGLVALRKLLCEIPFDREPYAAVTRLEELLAHCRRDNTVCLITHSFVPPMEAALCRAAKFGLQVHTYLVTPKSVQKLEARL